ncbi:MAG TPA: glycine zipper 2TM domain-containing protein, partial [Opitutaceae bacterium]|nr:glycine zipper 2TM domain-containing protein [Opitutaceae bacterium]
MKISILPLGISLLLGSASMKAQIFAPNLAGPGAVIGGIAGAVIGNHNHNTLAGAAIGTVAGAVIGSTIQTQPSYPVYRSGATYVVQDAPLAPAAPVYGEYPQTMVVQQPAPQIVYVERPVTYYYEPAPVYRPYCEPYPSVGLSFYYGSGYRNGWYGGGYRERGDYR